MTRPCPDLDLDLNLDLEWDLEWDLELDNSELIKNIDSTSFSLLIQDFKKYFKIIFIYTEKKSINYCIFVKSS